MFCKFLQRYIFCRLECIYQACVVRYNRSLSNSYQIDSNYLFNARQWRLFTKHLGQQPIHCTSNFYKGERPELLLHLLYVTVCWTSRTYHIRYYSNSEIYSSFAHISDRVYDPINSIQMDCGTSSNNVVVLHNTIKSIIIICDVWVQRTPCYSALAKIVFLAWWMPRGTDKEEYSLYSPEKI